MGGYKIWEEDRKEAVTDDGPTVVRTLRVEPYSARLQVAAYLKGGWFVAGTTVVYKRGQPDPWYPLCRCNEVEISPVEMLDNPQASSTGNAILGTRNSARSARLVAKYKPFLQGPDKSDDAASEKELASLTWDFKASQLTVPGKFWGFEDNPSDLLQAEGLQAAMVIPMVDYAMTRNYCFAIPYVAIQNLLGTVNQYPYLVPDYFKRNAVTWPAETLRLDGVSIQQKISTNQYPFFVITYRFAILCKRGRVVEVYPYTRGVGTQGVPPGATSLGDPADGFQPFLLAGRHAVGWNRIFRPSKGFWARPKLTGDPVQTVYDYAEPYFQTLGGRQVVGFDAIFAPGAT